MAKSQKKQPPSLPQEIAVPQSLLSLMQAFHVDSEKAANSLIIDLNFGF